MKQKFDIVIIGGGPAGLIAAGRAAENGSRVILIEKNDELGKKLLLTGHGRCNITNNIIEVKDLIKRYGESGKSLMPVFFNFGVTESLRLLKKLGLKLNTESTGRVFPKSDKASEVVSVLQKYVLENGGKIICDEAVNQILKQNDNFMIKTFKSEIVAKKVVIATGGVGYPQTGSTGDGFVWLKKLGHNIIKPWPGLVPIALIDRGVKILAGISLEKATITLKKDGKKIQTVVGDILFTHTGLSGPAILNLSDKVDKETRVVIDLFPDLTLQELDERLILIFNHNNNKKIINLNDLNISSKLWEFILKRLNIDKNKQINTINRDTRRMIVGQLKELTFIVKNTLGFEAAMYSRGGITLKDVNLRTMESKIVPNLYLCGDVLDVERESGGFSLQMCWSTGYLAGDSVSKR